MKKREAMLAAKVKRLLSSAVTAYFGNTISDLDLSYRIKDLHDMGMSTRAIAAAFDRSKLWVNCHLVILGLEQETLALMKAPSGKRLTLDNAVSLTNLIGTPKLQIETAKEICRQNLNSKQARRLIWQKTRDKQADKSANQLSGQEIVNELIEKAQQAQAFLNSAVTSYRAKTITELELARALKQAVSMGISQTTIARAFGFGYWWVSKRLAIPDLEPETLKLMSASSGTKLSTSNAIELTALIGQAELQIKLAREICRRQLSVARARRLIKEGADKAQVLLATDIRLLEKEFESLIGKAKIADEWFYAWAKVSQFRFKAMLKAYEDADARRLAGHLSGCAKNCASMARMVQNYLAEDPLIKEPE